MSKGSNIRPRTVSKKQWDEHWDRIFNQSGKKQDCAESTVKNRNGQSKPKS